jgi:geranylgeranyl pyrophosphate synthase
LSQAHPFRRPDDPVDIPALSATGGGRATEHLKEVPGRSALRQRIREAVGQLAENLDKSRPLARHEMESHARMVLVSLELPESYLGWTMVALASAFWRSQVAAVPHDRRLLLLPQCLRNEDSCPGEVTELGLMCRDCGACKLTDLRAQAERRGYKVMIAEGSPTVMKIILGGYVDALMGVACLDVLENTLDKILLSGIPCMAVPLLSNGCRNTTAEEKSILDMIETPHIPAPTTTRTYVHLMRCAAQMFEPEELDRLMPRARGGPSLAAANGEGIDGIEPIACTEAIAYDFLASGGKHTRPFITLAVYDAILGDGLRTPCTGPGGARNVALLPDAVKRVALAIETFHKASLVHDDIEDDDAVRYGRSTLHRKFGSATAINVGDYLVGLGYRLVIGQREALGAETAADLLAQFARAHTKLCEGQGAELAWRELADKRIKPLDALKIYALKTAPAFEAALMAGIRLAGPVEPYREAVARFSRHLGVAYQIINDLDDWRPGGPDQRERGVDVLGGRPTVLWALALERLNGPDREELETLVSSPRNDPGKVARAAELYRKADVFRQASALISKHHQRAGAAADQLANEPLRRLLHFFADAVLDRRSLAVNEDDASFRRQSP